MADTIRGSQWNFNIFFQCVAKPSPQGGWLYAMAMYVCLSVCSFGLFVCSFVAAAAALPRSGRQRQGWVRAKLG